MHPPFGPDPMSMFAVRALASLEPRAGTQAALAKFRTAILTTLAAAGVDTSKVLDKPAASFRDGQRHVLVVWYDVAAAALRVFVPPATLFDEIDLDALALLNGQLVIDLDRLPIEDVDATARIMALIGEGGNDAADLHARFIGPQLRRYDDDFTPPAVSDFAARWRSMFPHFVGGTRYPLPPLDAWIDRVFAFGVGWFPPPETRRAPSKTAKGSSRSKRATSRPKAKATKPKASKASKAKPKMSKPKMSKAKPTKASAKKRGR